MENVPNHDQRIIEALEVCRPGSDDLADPGLRILAEAMETDAGLARLYAQLQEVDGCVAAAFADVPVPEGLETRLRERLGIAVDRSGSLAEDSGEGSGQTLCDAAIPECETPVPPGETKVQPVPGALRGGRRARRRLLVGGGTAVAAALVVGAMVALSNRGHEYTPQAVREAAIRFHDREKPEAWGRTEAPSEYPFSPAVARLPDIKWRPVSGLLDSRGVAYDLRGPGGVQATLYVLKQKVAGLAPAPDLRPYSTGGLSVEAWQKGGLLYVLVVESGDQRTYQQFLDYRAGPLT